MYDSERVEKIWWDRELFRWGDHPEQVCPLVMDVTGPHRVLAFGPYVPLSAGLWRAIVTFDVDWEAAKRFYRIDLGTDAGFTHRNFRPSEPGRQSVAVDHIFDGDGLAWVRLAVAAAFHGQLAHIGVDVEPILGVAAAA